MMSLNKNNFIRLLLLLTFFNFSCQKEVPNSEQLEGFVKFFGGANSNDAVDLIDDNDSYIIAGNQYDADNISSIVIYKTDKYGNTQWKDTIGQEGQNTKVSQLIKLQQQEGYGLIGTVETDDQYFTDILFAIISADGTVKTQRIYNDTLYESGKCIAELPDENLILTATVANSAGVLGTVKLFYLIDNEGNIQKSSDYNGSDVIFSDITYNKNNGALYIVGSSNKGTEVNILTDDFSFWGASTLSFNGSLNSVVSDNDNNLYICGKSNSGSNGRNDILIAKINNNNESMLFITNWQVELGASGDDYCSDIYLTTDNTLLVTGSIQDTKLGTYDFYTIELDTAGVVLHSSILGGSRDELGIRSLITFDQKVLTFGITAFNSSSFMSLEKYDWKSLK